MFCLSHFFRIATSGWIALRLCDLPAMNKIAAKAAAFGEALTGTLQCLTLRN